jgi:hypothetical protein
VSKLCNVMKGDRDAVIWMSDEWMFEWLMRADRAHALAERLHAAESQLEQLAEAGGAPVVVFPARYPAATGPYRNIFLEDTTAAQPAAHAGSDVPCSPAGGTSPAASEPAGELASGMLAGATEALKAATAGLQRLADDMAAAASAAGVAGAADVATGRVPGRDTVELFHFFNQPLPMESQLRQEVGPFNEAAAASTQPAVAGALIWIVDAHCGCISPGHGQMGFSTCLRCP